MSLQDATNEEEQHAYVYGETKYLHGNKKTADADFVVAHLANPRTKKILSWKRRYLRERSIIKCECQSWHKCRFFIHRSESGFFVRFWSSEITTNCNGFAANAEIADTATATVSTGRATKIVKIS